MAPTDARKLKCPTCGETLTYEQEPDMSDTMTISSGGTMNVPVGRSTYYRCAEHGLMRFDGQRFWQIKLAP
jgi:hypothetical protein